eukprot:7511849-Pyramimonas_sp.AAC.1
MLDLFSGVSRASKSLVDLGHSAEVCDVKNGPAFHFAEKTVLGRLLRSPRASLFDCAMLAPPSTTFSIAQRPALRTAEERITRI